MEKNQNYINEINVTYARKAFFNTVIHNSESASEIAREIFAMECAQLELKEHFYIIRINRPNTVIGFHKLSEGGISGTVVDIRIAFAVALKSLASGVILVHNHPSGKTHPSDADLEITKKFKEAGNLLDILILDHIILSTVGYSSFADEGWI